MLLRPTDGAPKRTMTCVAQLGCDPSIAEAYGLEKQFRLGFALGGLHKGAWNTTLDAK